MLMSLVQMRNLRFCFDLSPEAAWLWSPAIGYWLELELSTSRHLVLDLSLLNNGCPGMSKIISTEDANLKYPVFEAVQEKTAEVALVVQDQKVRFSDQL